MAARFGKRTSVRYAGPASRALIEARPIGRAFVRRPTAKAMATQLPVDKLDIAPYVARNSAPHASASACAPGGTFFALIAGESRLLAEAL